MIYLEDIILPIILMIAFVLFMAHCDTENTKELEIIKKTKDFTIYENCKLFDGEWYCYD